MGTRNKERRAAKAKRRARDRARRSAEGSWQRAGSEPGQPLFTPRERIHALLELAAFSAGGGPVGVDEVLARLAASDAALVDRETEGMLLLLVGELWRHGWQPAELVRHARRFDGRTGRLVATAVAADHAQRHESTLHPRWAAQVEALELPAVPGATGWLSGFTHGEALGRRAAVEAAVMALQLLAGVGRLHVLIPPPGAVGAPTCEPPAEADDPVLAKVRALLAQAESTTFEAEAEAFTAKAQELMARHAIDGALLWAHRRRDERPTTIRLPIDDPYADIKSLLLQRVAYHSRCSAVFHPRYGLTSVVGFASDVAATEMLFTSLLVQSQTALQAEAATAAPGARTRGRSFRSSFLLSFTNRIDERLAEINAAVERAADVEHGGSLLPVLAARGSAVDDAVREMFGTLQSNIVRGGSDLAGWVRGKMAADQAHLNFGHLDGAARPDSAPDQPVPALGV